MHQTEGAPLQTRLPLPYILLVNVSSLQNKMYLLQAKCLAERAFEDACIIALTRLDEAVPDSKVSVDHFTATGPVSWAERGVVSRGGSHR